LIALIILLVGGSVEIGRDWHLTVTIEIRLHSELQQSGAVLKNLSYCRCRPGDLDDHSQSELFSRADHGCPESRGAMFEKQYFDFSRGIVQTSWDHPAVIEHEKIGG
jgi:hypothetical protein